MFDGPTDDTRRTIPKWLIVVAVPFCMPIAFIETLGKEFYRAFGQAANKAMQELDSAKRAWRGDW